MMRAEAPEFRFVSEKKNCPEDPIKQHHDQQQRQVQPPQPQKQQSSKSHHFCQINHDQNDPYSKSSCAIEKETENDTSLNDLGIGSQATKHSKNLSTALRSTAKEFVMPTKGDGQSGALSSTKASSLQSFTSHDHHHNRLRSNAIPFVPEQNFLNYINDTASAVRSDFARLQSFDNIKTPQSDIITSSSTNLGSEAKVFNYDMNKTRIVHDDESPIQKMTNQLHVSSISLPNDGSIPIIDNGTSVDNHFSRPSPAILNSLLIDKDISNRNFYDSNRNLESLPMEQQLCDSTHGFGWDEYATTPSSTLLYDENKLGYVPVNVTYTTEILSKDSDRTSHLSTGTHGSYFQKRPLCRFFASGACRKGIDCPFLHDSSRAVNVLATFQQEESSQNNKYDKIPNPFMLEEGIEVVFDSGASVLEFRLGIDYNNATNGDENSKTIILSGLSNQVNEHDLQLCLSKFGVITYMDLKKSLDGSSCYANLSYADGQSALDAVQALNGCPIHALLDNHDDSSKKKENVKKNKKKLHSSPLISVVLKQAKPALRNQSSGAACKVQWYAPSRCAWVYFKTINDAGKVAACCNNQMLKDRTISTSFKAPPLCSNRFRWTHIQPPTSYSVWFGNLEESVTKNDLIKFVVQCAKIKVDSVCFGELSFKESESVQIIRTLLEQHGRVLSFELGKDTPKIGDLKRKALVRFADDEHAQKACEHFQRVQRVDELGGSRLFIQRVVTLKYTFPENTLDILKSTILIILKEFPNVRYTFYDNVRSKTILISADNSIIIDTVKPRLEPHIRGEVVKERKGGSILWNNFLSSNEFKDRIIKDFGYHVDASIWCDRRRREVRVFGSNEHRMKTIESIYKLCEEMNVATFSVPVTEDQYKHILQTGRSFLDRLKLATNCRKVSIDLKNKALLVEGGTMEAMRVMSQVSRLINGSNITSEDIIDHDTYCPICFCPPDEETMSTVSDLHRFVRLSCKHVYCTDCFRCWLTGFNTCDFPLKCVSDSCNTLVSLDDIGKFLNGEILASFLRAAVDDYVRKNVMRYKFCLVPTCPGIYEIKNSVRQSACSTCSQEVCTNCNASHGKMTCQQYKLSTLPPDQLRMQIVDDILTLRCPRCKQAFLDFDGCFAISCNVCPCNFCGWCLMDCQGDAHPHVKECHDRHPNAQSYFGTQDQFQQAQNKKRIEKLKIFLKDYSVANRITILESIKNDLDDLGISTTLFH